MKRGELVRERRLNNSQLENGIFLVVQAGRSYSRDCDDQWNF